MANKNKLNLPILLVVAFLGALAGRSHAGSPPVDKGGTLAPLCALWNAPAPVISAGLIAGGFTPSQETSVMRIGATLAIDGPLYVTESDGTTTLTFALNNGTSLTGGKAWTGVWPLRKHTTYGGATAITYNFALGTTTNGTVPAIRADECLPGVD